MAKRHRVLMTVMVIGLAAAVGGFGIFAAFSDTTDNPGNSFAAGTVAISDNDGEAALFGATDATPGDYDRCITVTYTGSLDAAVKLYSSAITGTGSSFNLTVTEGSGTPTADCTGFTAGTDVYTGTLANFATTHSAWASGLSLDQGGDATWSQNDAVPYRFRITVPDDNAAQGDTVDPFTLTWEAQNQ